MYLATFLILGYASAFAGVRLYYWPALIAVALATFTTVRLFEKGRWPVGFFVPPGLAMREAGLGLILGAVLVGVCDLVILASTDLRHTGGTGFSWRELAIVYIPAAIHEEVLFRGYLYQRLRRVNPAGAIVVSSVVFGLVHLQNSGITAIAVVNITAGGVMLAVAYNRFERLWFPIGLHLAWNWVSGAVLGYGVSGYGGEGSVLRLAGTGPGILTGGVFGLEGSVWAILVEVGAVTVMLRKGQRPPL